MPMRLKITASAALTTLRRRTRRAGRPSWPHTGSRETGSGWFSYGFAGSRVDAVVEIPPKYLTLYEKHTGKPAFGEAFTGSVDENSAIQQYMWGMLDFPLYFQMNKVFCRSESWSNIKWVLDQDEKYKNAHRLFTFIDNHDRARFLANAGADRAKLRMALAFLYAARGIPVVYYGTEQNMAGDLRYSEATLNTINRQVMTSFDEGGATYIYIQRLNELRQAYPDVFVDGIQRELYFCGDDPVYAFCRRSVAAGDVAVCIFNNSPIAQSRTISLEMAGIKAGTLLTDLLDTSCVIRAQKKKAADAVTVDVTVRQTAPCCSSAGTRRSIIARPSRKPNGHPLRHRFRSRAVYTRKHFSAQLGARHTLPKHQRRYLAVCNREAGNRQP